MRVHLCSSVVPISAACRRTNPWLRLQQVSRNLSPISRARTPLLSRKRVRVEQGLSCRVDSGCWLRNRNEESRRTISRCFSGGGGGGDEEDLSCRRSS